jgi:hypothetical protein
MPLFRPRKKGSEFTASRPVTKRPGSPAESTALHDTARQPRLRIVRWLRGVLLAVMLVVAACGNDKAKPVPSAHVEDAKRLCAALLSDTNRGINERDFLPKELKDDWDQWHVNNDADRVHIGRLNDYTLKSCGFSWENPVTSTVPSTTTPTTAAP